jgi:riboflavin synthase
MYTGIVQSLCEVRAVADEPGLRRLTVRMGALASGLDAGASVAVNGTCLTVTGNKGTDVRFDVIRQTLETTNLGDVVRGARVNVERSFRVGDEVGGHLLSGHVSGTATVVRVEEAPNERTLFLRAPEALTKYLSPKGFVALDGASLTIAGLDRARREAVVCLIPETIARTTLGTVRAGDRVNLEVDAQTQTIVDTVERLSATDPVNAVSAANRLLSTGDTN